MSSQEESVKEDASKTRKKKYDNSMYVLQILR